MRRRVATGDGVGLSIVEAGPAGAPPLVMIPGWSQSAVEFKHQIEDLSRDHRVVAVDMRGHGESEKPAHGYRISRLAADLHDLLVALDLRDVAVLGHSMGSSVIWCYLELYGPERLGRLLLIDQAPACTARPGWDDARHLRAGILFRDAATAEDRAHAFASAATAEGTAALLAGMFTRSFSASELRWVAEENLKLPRRLAADLLIDHVGHDWSDAIGRIRLPTLVVGGRRSIFSAESQEWIASQIPGARVRIFEEDEGGSHFMFLENPAGFNDEVRRFLAAAR